MTNLQLQNFYQVPISTITRLKKKGINVLDPFAVADKILGQTRRPASWTNGKPFTDAQAKAFIAGNPSVTDVVEPHKDEPDDERTLRERAKAAKTYDEARFCLTQAKALKEARQLDVLEGAFMSKADAQADFARLGYALRAGINSMSSDLAPALAGLDEITVARKVKEAGLNILRMLGDDESKLYDGAPPAAID